MHQQDHKGTD